MVGLWGALKSCLKAGDKVVTVGTGVFGDGFADMAESLGCVVDKVSFPYDSTITRNDLERIDEAIKRTKPVMITAVHCETPSGTLNPLEELGKLKKERNVVALYRISYREGGIRCREPFHEIRKRAGASCPVRAWG